jgi:hypothetical protein
MVTARAGFFSLRRALPASPCLTLPCRRTGPRSARSAANGAQCHGWPFPACGGGYGPMPQAGRLSCDINGLRDIVVPDGVVGAISGPTARRSCPRLAPHARSLWLQCSPSDA